MNARQIPLHMLLLAGLVSPAGAADDAPSAAKAPKAKAEAAASAPAPAPAAYAGLNALPPTDEERAALGDRLPAGAGLRVGVVDPDGPAVDQLQPGDVLVRFDDQLLVNFDQFRSLVQMRRPGDTVKFSVIRNGSTMTVPVKLSVRPAGVEARDGRSRPVTPADALRQDSAGGRTIHVGPGFVINIGPGAVAFPPEVLRQLEELQARGLLAQPGAATGSARSRKSAGSAAPDATVPAQPGLSTSRSFSFSLGSGASSSSKTLLSDGEGSVSLEESDGKRHATVKDAQGKVLFEGEITTEEQRAKLPEDVRRRLKAVEGGVFTVPGAPGAAPAAPKAPAPAKKYDPKKGA